MSPPHQRAKMTYLLADYIAKVRTRLMEVDSSLEISEEDIKSAISTGLAYHSRFIPRRVVADLTSTGTYDLALPTTWDASFSTIISIEYPLGTQVPVLLSPNNYMIYASPTGQVLRLLGTTPASGAKARVTFTAPHSVTYEESSITDGDFEAVSGICAAMAARILAARYARAWDPTLMVDVVNFRAKAQEYLSLARELEIIWRVSMGIGDKGYGPAMTYRDWDSSFSTGGRLLTHPRH